MSRAVRVRPPAVAGTFYPADPTALAAAVDHFVADALGRRPGRPGTEPPRALVAPHAGYRYSGPVAASAYATVAGHADGYRHVVLLGPAHRVPLRGVALSSADAFATPLGPVAVDLETRAAVAELGGVVVDDGAHAEEHSLEVHLPFLRRVVGDVPVLPLVVGAAPADLVAAVLEATWGHDTLVVVSTDLSHYEDHDAAARHDAATAEAVVARDGDAIGPYDACGAYPLRGLLAEARARDLAVQLLDLRSSGDTSGPRDRVVGYGAFAFAPRGTWS